MKTSILTLLLLSFSLTFFAQENIQLHPVIGDTISQNEKILFLLFPDIPDSSFQYATLQHKTDSIFILDEYVSNQHNKKELCFNELNYYKENIDKLLTYYASLNNASHPNEQINSNTPLHYKTPIYISLTSDQLEKMTKEAKRYNALKLEAEEKGLWGTERDNYIKTKGYWDFPIIGNQLNKHLNSF